MMNFGAMNDSYYQPDDNRAWDAFIDYCDSNDLNPDDEDFEAWVEAERERGEDEAAERAMERDRDDFYQDSYYE